MLGQRVNNFEIVRLLGQGGMGAVYEAEHLLIKKKVAVKVLKPELGQDADLLQRFFNEARATSAIRHPNIVEVIDLGFLPDGMPYLVMELLEGESLGDRLARVGKLELESALDFATQTASALLAAHENGIVHRDLKPDNLYLVRDQRFRGRELVKVLDFGIAKLRDPAAAQVDTVAGTIWGTPPYMSPEQCRGLPSQIDHRTDIYALGVILYEALAGQLPFVAEGVGDVMMMHMSTEPLPLSEHLPSVPRQVERAIMRALAKRPAARFASMAEFSAALHGQEGSLATLPLRAAALGPKSDRVLVDSTQPTESETIASTPPPAARPGRIRIAALLALGVVIAAFGLARLGRHPNIETTSTHALHAARAPATPIANPPAAAIEAPPRQPEPNAQPEPVSNVGSVSSKSVKGRNPRANTNASSSQTGKHTASTPLAPSSAGSAATPTPASTQSPSIASAGAEPPNAPNVTPGYLSLDSEPWANVSLGDKALGSTPLMRIPLAPGKHVLTLQNPELGASTSYTVEIKSGVTISRLVAWRKP